MRFAHIDRPCLFSNKESRIKTKGNPESNQVQNALAIVSCAAIQGIIALKSEERVVTRVA